MVLSRRLWWACLVFIFTAGLASAQVQTGKIEGRIVNGVEGVGGVTVLINETKSVEFSEEDGTFTFENMRPGSYTLILSLGDNVATQPEIVVTAGETTEVKIEVDWEVVYESVRVTAAARRAEKIVDAPSAVTSVAPEEIEREAAHGQLPKVLEFTPGAEVTQSGIYDFNFNTRGFNSSLNRRVATYVDGRDTGVPLLGAQEWAALSIPLDDLESLEFVRGPSAALYGANASAGVINMVTKAPRDSIGGFLRFTGGDLDTFNVDFRQAQEMGRGWYYKITAGVRNTGDFTVSRNPDFLDSNGDGAPDPNQTSGVSLITGQRIPEYSEFCRENTFGECLLRERSLFREQDNDITFGTARIDKHIGEKLLTFEVSATKVKGPVFQSGIGRAQVLNVRRPYGRINFSTPSWTVLASVGRRDGHQANLTKALRPGAFDLFSDTLRYATEAQYNRSFGENERWRFVIGGAYTYEDIDSLGSGLTEGEQTVVNRPITSHREAVFTQIDFKANNWLKLVGAGRVDRNTLHDTRFSPKLAAVFSMTPTQTVRLTFNKAFQVANYSELFLDANIEAILNFKGQVIGACALPFELGGGGLQITSVFGGGVLNPGAPLCLASEAAPLVKAVGNDDLTIERTQAWEVGYSGIIGKRMLLTLDYYTNDNEDFISDLLPQVFTKIEGGPLLNPDFPDWVGTDAAETTLVGPDGLVSVAERIRILLENVLAPEGAQLTNDLRDGSTIVVARTYENIGRVDTQGIDFGLNWFANDHWNVRASYSWFDFEIVDSGGIDLSGLAPGEARVVLEENLLPNSPEHKASLSVGYVRDTWDVSVSSRWVDGFQWNAGLFQGPVPDYTLVDIAATYRFGDHVKVGLNGSNVFDNKHYQSFGGDLLSRRLLVSTHFSW